MAFLDTDLDPFGDGSLVKSFTLNDKLTDEQTGADTFIIDVPQHAYSSGQYNSQIRFYNENHSPVNLVTSCNHTAGQYESHSFSVWLTCQGNTGQNYGHVDILEFAIGGISQRYGCGVKFTRMTNSSYSDWKDIQIVIGVHKLGDASPDVDSSGAIVYSNNSTRRALFTWAYDSITEETHCYIDKVLVYTATTKMGWLAKPLAECETIDSNTTLYHSMDQLMEWNRYLTQADVTNLYDNMTDVIDTTLYGQANLIGESNLESASKIFYKIAMLFSESSITSEGVIINPSLGEASLQSNSFLQVDGFWGYEYYASASLVSTGKQLLHSTTYYRMYPLFEAEASLLSSSILTADSFFTLKRATIFSSSNLTATAQVGVFGKANLVSNNNLTAIGKVLTLGKAFISSSSILEIEAIVTGISIGDRLTALEEQLDYLEDSLGSVPEGGDFIKFEDIKILLERIRYGG